MKKLLYLLTFLSSSLVFAQTYPSPKECTNPPLGYVKGGSFSAMQFACFDGIVTEKVLIKPSNINTENPNTVQFNFNYKGGAITVNPTSVKDTTYNKEGIYYILMTSLDKNQDKQIACAVVEVIKTDVPEIDVISCERNNFTVKIKDTEINRKHSGYRVIWGDSEKIDYYESKNLPFTFSHQYGESSLIVQPRIVGVYKRIGIEICNSQAIFFSGTSIIPKISSLETNNESNSFNLRHTNFYGKGYDILAQEKGGSQWSFVGKTTDNLTSVSNLDTKKEYFFKLSLKQAECSNTIESDTIANIILSFQENTFKWATRAKELQKNIPYEFQVVWKNRPFEVLEVFNKTSNEFYDIGINNWDKYVNKDFRVSLKIKDATIWSNIVSLPPLGNESNELDLIKIYPLPFVENINLSSSIKIDKIEVIDTNGRMILKKSVEENQVLLHELSPGRYLLKLFNQDNKPISTKTIIKL